MNTKYTAATRQMGMPLCGSNLATGLERHIGNDGKHNEGDILLDDFQLNEREGPAIALKADSVGRHLTAVLKECYSPRECDNTLSGAGVHYPPCLLKT